MMKKPYFFIFPIACALLLAGCSPSGGSDTSSSTPISSDISPTLSPEDDNGIYHKITSEEAKEMIDAGGVTVVDVRTSEEYTQKHIPGAVLIPNESIGKKPPEKLPDKNAVLLVYCRSGVRSKQASEKLAQLGYSKIYDFGGIIDWPYETEIGEAK